MLPQDCRAVVLSHDATLDLLAIELYRSADGRRGAELSRALASKRAELERAVGRHCVAPGDLRR